MKQLFAQLYPVISIIVMLLIRMKVMKGNQKNKHEHTGN